MYKESLTLQLSLCATSSRCSGDGCDVHNEDVSLWKKDRLDRKASNESDLNEPGMSQNLSMNFTHYACRRDCAPKLKGDCFFQRQVQYNEIVTLVINKHTRRVTCVVWWLHSYGEHMSYI